MESMALILVPCVVLYWCNGKVSAEEFRQTGEALSDIQSISIPISSTKVYLDSNNLGSSGIPGNYFVVSDTFFATVSLVKVILG